MTTETLFYKFYLRNYDAYDEQLVALVSYKGECFNNKYPIFTVEHIDSNSLWIAPRNIRIGDQFYSFQLTAPPTKKAFVPVHDWIQEGERVYYGNHGTAEDELPNAEFIAVPAAIGELVRQKSLLEKQLDSINAKLDYHEFSF